MIMLVVICTYTLLDIYVLSDRVTFPALSRDIAVFPWLAAAGIAAPFLGGLFSGGQSRANVRDTNQANMALARYSYSKDLEMWNRQNAYNAPSEQMKRFQQAGLNPNMIYGQGNPGNAQQMPRYNTPTQDFSSREPMIQNLPQSISMFQDMKLRQAQVDNLRANQKNVEMRTITEATKNAMLAVATKLQAAKTNQINRLTPGQEAQLDAQVSKLRFDTRRGETLLPYQSQVARAQAGASKYAVDMAFQNLKNLRAQFQQLLLNQQKTKVDTIGSIQQNVLKADTHKKNKWEQAIRDRYGINPSETLIGLISKALAEGVSNFAK